MSVTVSRGKLGVYLEEATLTPVPTDQTETVTGTPPREETNAPPPPAPETSKSYGLTGMAVGGVALIAIYFLMKAK